MTADLRRITEEVVARPASWDRFRDQVRAEFDESAERYEQRLADDHLAPLRAALARVATPRWALDVGCGTGVGADLLAEVFPSASVYGLDLSAGMIAVAVTRRLRRIRFVVGDASALPFADSTIDLVISIAVPIFAREISRILVPGGATIAAFPLGEQTPIFLPPATLSRVFLEHGLTAIEHGRSSRGTFTLATKPT